MPGPSQFNYNINEDKHFILSPKNKAWNESLFFLPVLNTVWLFYDKKAMPTPDWQHHLRTSEINSIMKYPKQSEALQQLRISAGSTACTKANLWFSIKSTPESHYETPLKSIYVHLQYIVNSPNVKNKHSPKSSHAFYFIHGDVWSHAAVLRISSLKTTLNAFLQGFHISDIIMT